MPPGMGGTLTDQVMPQDVASVTLALGLESYGPGLTRDLYMTVKIVPPGNKSRVTVTTSQKDQVTDGNWTIATSLDNPV